MDRRAFLATGVGLVTATAGCLGTDDDIQTGRVTVGGTISNDEETVPSGTVAEVDGGTMRLTATDIQRSVVAPQDGNRVYEPANTQFLVARLDTSDLLAENPVENLKLLLDGKPPELPQGTPRVVNLSPSERADRRGSTDIAFAVPTAAPSSVRIQFSALTNVSWQIPDSLVDRFQIRPNFFLAAADIVEQRGETELALTVENRGDRDGVFRCTTAGDAEQPEPVRFTVRASGRATVSITNDAVSGWPPDAQFTHPIRPDTRAFVVDA